MIDLVWGVCDFDVLMFLFLDLLIVENVLFVIVFGLFLICCKLLILVDFFVVWVVGFFNLVVFCEFFKLKLFFEVFLIVDCIGCELGVCEWVFWILLYGLSFCFLLVLLFWDFFLERFFLFCFLVLLRGLKLFLDCFVIFFCFRVGVEEKNDFLGLVGFIKGVLLIVGGIGKKY